MPALLTCATAPLLQPAIARERPAAAFTTSTQAAKGRGRPRRAAVTASAAGSERASRRAALAALVAGVAAVGASPAVAAGVEAREGEVRHSDAEWRQLLSPDAYRVLRQAGTEKRFSSPLVEEHRAGTFVCGGCGAPLFPSSAKYESGTGWPSFYDAVPGAVQLTGDSSIPFMPRVEVRCARCQGHLGHVFDDGPRPTGLRFCMNGAALRFEPQQA